MAINAAVLLGLPSPQSIRQMPLKKISFIIRAEKAVGKYYKTFKDGACEAAQPFPHTRSLGEAFLNSPDFDATVSPRLIASIEDPCESGDGAVGFPPFSVQKCFPRLPDGR